ncbi:hypothetical protein M8C21_014202 [Ambrosia artemisiifolia]|uniref:Uncharacterized protein n=1 Tax=Ambrosia artemisiifolia TaxID=4212 RepID=A0AAD5GNU6_AMBAR|nr:hypothetical protein M8C21_014202 [Ambrosia artemisiifolia]
MLCGMIHKKKKTGTPFTGSSMHLVAVTVQDPGL